MKTRSHGLLVLVVLAVGVYGLGWLIGGQLNAAVRRADRGSAPTQAEVQSETAAAPASPADADQGARREAEHQAALLAERRATLQTLEAKVLQLDQAGKPRLACDALGDLEPLLRCLAPADFPGVWKWFGRLKSPIVRLLVQRAVLSAWSRVDPRAALAAVSTLPNPTEWIGGEVFAYKPLEMVLSRWAETEPEAALAGSSQLPEDLRLYARGIVSNTMTGVGRTGPLDPDAALAWAQTVTNSASAKRALNGSARAGSDPDNGPREQAFREAFRAFVAAGRATEAAAFVSSLPESNERRRLVSELASQWAYLDIQGATAWVSHLSGDVSLRNAAWDGLKERWVQQEPASAVRFALAALPAGERRTAEFRNIAIGSLAVGTGRVYDDDVAWNLTQQLPAGPERDVVAAALSERWMQYAPDQAARLVATMRPGEEQSRVAIKAALEWATWDPAAAAAWAASFPAGPVREQALPVVARQWACKDAAAASDWLQTLPSDSGRAKAAEAHISKIEDTRPELAARWVTSLPDGEKRNQEVEKIARAWSKTDPKTAQAWLETVRSTGGQKP